MQYDEDDDQYNVVNDQYDVDNNQYNANKYQYNADDDWWWAYLLDKYVGQPGPNEVFSPEMDKQHIFQFPKLWQKY